MLATTLLPVLVAAGLTADARQPAPNAILVLVDALRADHLGCYGYERDTSPRLDRLAAEGARFETVVAPTSWTLPSHVTLFTALPPESHRVVLGTQRLGDDILTLAEVLRDAGWATAGFAAGPYVSSRFGLGQGFETYDESLIAGSLLEANAAVTSPRLVELAREWLDRWERDAARRPFFLFLHAWDPHFDYVPPPPHDRLFDPGYDGTLDARRYARNEAVHAAMDPRDLAHVVALYDGEIRFTDLHLGLVLDDLERRGVLGETLVVVTADHGEEFFEHGGKGHRRTLYDEVVLVPLLVRWPGRVPAGLVVREMAGLADVAPTILALAGVETPAAFGAPDPAGGRLGRDLTPLLRTGGGAWTERAAFADLEGVVALARTPDHSFVKSLEQGGGEELHDLAADPGQRVNVVAGQPAPAAELRDALRRWRTERALPRTAEVEAAETDAATLEQLRALGYVQ